MAEDGNGPVFCSAEDWLVDPTEVVSGRGTAASLSTAKLNFNLTFKCVLVIIYYNEL